MSAEWIEDGVVPADQPTISFSWDTVKGAQGPTKPAFEAMLELLMERARNRGPMPAVGGFIAYLMDVTLMPDPEKPDEERGQWWVNFCDVDPVSRLSHPVSRVAVIINYSGKTGDEDEEDRNAITIMHAVDRILRRLHAACEVHLALLGDGRLAVPIITLDLKDGAQCLHLCRCVRCKKTPSRVGPKMGHPAQNYDRRRETESGLRVSMGQKPIPNGSVVDPGFAAVIEAVREAAGPEGTVAHPRDALCLGCAARPGKTMACARCQRAFFCGVECQRKLWKAHKASCAEFAKVK